MESRINHTADLEAELQDLRRQLEEANETIEAIRTGQVDALVVHSGEEPQLFTLRTADHAYRVFIEKMTEGALTLNREGLVLYANSQFAAMVGMPLSQVMGLPFPPFVAPAFGAQFRQLFEACWQEDCKGEIALWHNNRHTPVQISLTPLELEEGISLSIILTDLTHQKAAQQQLEENNYLLDQLNKTLEASNHDLQQFASVASHDLQEPLRKIQMFANQLKTKAGNKLTADEQRYLDKVLASAGRMKTLIVDVLNYSRLSSNNGTFIASDLNSLMEELLEDFELMIAEKNATITCCRLPVLEVNRGQIRQVFQNLLSNALKFSAPQVPPVITISAQRLSAESFDAAVQDDGPYCLLSIKDNGIGFDEKYTANIFSLFERLHPKEQYEGSGIGLAITKKIIEKHNGHIQVKSSVGKGAEFKLLLPVLHNP